MLVMGVLDALWLGVLARDFYRQEMGTLMAEQVRWLPAALFYFGYPAALVALALFPAGQPLAHQVARAALVGLVGFFARRILRGASGRSLDATRQSPIAAAGHRRTPPSSSPAKATPAAGHTGEPAPPTAPSETEDREVRRLRTPPHSMEAERSVLGGILIEAVQMGDQRQVVIGIGLNVRRAPLPNTQGVQVLDDRWTAPMLLQQSVLALVPALRRFDAEGFAPFRASFESLDLLRQQSLTTTLADLPSGIGAGVDMTGALQLLTPDGLKTVHSGEVSVRPC